MGIRFSDLGLALHQDRIIDATRRRSGFLHLGEVENYMALSTEPGFRMRAKSRSRSKGRNSS
jgi:hypothetical protein